MSSWKEDASFRREVKSGQRELKPVIPSAKKPKVEKPWCVRYTYSSRVCLVSKSLLKRWHERNFEKEIDARKFLLKLSAYHDEIELLFNGEKHKET